MHRWHASEGVTDCHVAGGARVKSATLRVACSVQRFPLNAAPLPSLRFPADPPSLIAYVKTPLPHSNFIFFTPLSAHFGHSQITSSSPPPFFSLLFSTLLCICYSSFSTVSTLLSTSSNLFTHLTWWPFHFHRRGYVSILLEWLISHWMIPVLAFVRSTFK